jgi:hypothetical protein
LEVRIMLFEGKIINKSKQEKESSEKSKKVSKPDSFQHHVKKIRL